MGFINKAQDEMTDELFIIEEDAPIPGYMELTHVEGPYDEPVVFHVTQALFAKVIRHYAQNAQARKGKT